MNLVKAQQYLKDVLAHKRCVPFAVYNGHVGRTAQATEFGLTQGTFHINNAYKKVDGPRNQ